MDYEKQSLILFLILLSFIPQISFSQPAEIPQINGFEGWKSVTSEPILVPEYLYKLCRPLTAEEEAVKESPHRKRYIRVRVNPKGEKVFYGNNSESFPSGSVIVKEKFSDGKFERAESLGVMIKNEKDWDFAYKNEDGKITQGHQQLESCYTCHASLKDRDQVFRTYIKR